MRIKKDIKFRTYLITLLLCIVVIGYIYQLFNIQFIDNEKWEKLSQKLKIKKDTTEYRRGTIYSCNNEALAISEPFFELRLDTQIYTAENNPNFLKDLKELSQNLSGLFKNKSADFYYKYILNQGYTTGHRYLLIAKKVTYNQMKEAKKFPIFRLGRYKGGLITKASYKRYRPFGELAKRTIGIARDKASVGIERAFNDYISGYTEENIYFKNEDREWVESRTNRVTDQKRGFDVISTLDMNIQDIAHTELLRSLQKYDAEQGVLIVMEVKTGDIKAIVNLKKGEESKKYSEVQNYAIQERIEPGSLMKLASYMVCLKDGVFKLTDEIDTGNGSMSILNKTVKDWNIDKGGFGKITMAEAFRQSSNIAITKQVSRHYDSKDDGFSEGLKNLHLNKKLDLQILGEREPLIYGENDFLFNKYTQMSNSFGYELELTPLQILTFYNAVANNGKMIAPIFVTEIKDLYETVTKFKARVIDDEIAPQNIISQLQFLLEGVVKSGTAKNIRSSDMLLAGKSGTTQLRNANNKYTNAEHRAMFCGYFPADNPKYSCIVSITRPNEKLGAYSGSIIAAPVFAKVARSIYSIDPEIYNRKIKKSESNKTLEVTDEQVEKHIFNKRTTTKKINVDSIRTKSGALKVKIPKLIGMDLSTVLYTLSQLGIKPKIQGNKLGKVVYQNLKAGQFISQNSSILIRLGS